MNRYMKLAALSLACASVSACASTGKLNPFHKKGAHIEAAKGERIPVLAYDNTVKPSEALAGVGFQIPEAQPVTAWPLPGGTPEQSVENVQAAPDFAVADVETFMQAARNLRPKKGCLLIQLPPGIYSPAPPGMPPPLGPG